MLTKFCHKGRERPYRGQRNMRYYYSHINKIMFVVLTVFMTSAAVQALPFICQTNCTASKCAADEDLARKCKANCPLNSVKNCLAAATSAEKGGTLKVSSDPKILEEIKKASLAAHMNYQKDVVNKTYVGANPKTTKVPPSIKTFYDTCDKQCTPASCKLYRWQFAYCKYFCRPASKTVEGCLKAGELVFPNEELQIEITDDDDQTSQTGKRKQQPQSGKGGTPSVKRPATSSQQQRRLPRN